MQNARSALNRQLLQLLDAALVWVAFLAASRLLDPALAEHEAWLLYLVVPFSPLILEGVGFYRQRSGTAAAGLRLLGGLAVVGLLILALTTSSSLRLEKPAVVAVGFIFTLILLLARDTFVAHFAGPAKPRSLP